MDGGGLRRLTTGLHDHREPRFSPDGTRIVFGRDVGGSCNLWVLDLRTGQQTQLTSTDADEGEPNWAPDGSRVVCTVDGTAIDAVGLAGGRQRLVEPVADTRLFGPGFAPDGALTYTSLRGAVTEIVVGGRVVTEAEDLFGFPVEWIGASTILYTADGGLRTRDLGTGAKTPVPFDATGPSCGRARCGTAGAGPCAATRTSCSTATGSSACTTAATGRGCPSWTLPASP